MKYKVVHMNVIKLYLKGIENLVKYFNSLKNKNKTVLFNRVPGLSKIKSRKVQNFVWSISVIGEPVVSFIIETVMLFPYLWKALNTKRQPLSEKLYIDNCPLLKQRTYSAGLYEDSKDWLYGFFVSENEKDYSKTVHTLFEYLNIRDVVWAYCMAVVATFASLRKTKFKYVMRNYSSFEYCMFYRYLRNIPRDTTICFCNQMDKWALMFDDAPLNKILFQHGIEMPEANWPHKLKSIDTVYVLSLEESRNLFHAAFDRNPSNIYVMEPTIKLSPVDSRKYNILIVGFPGYSFFDKESFLVKTFSGSPYYVYLKPHPGKEDMTKYKNLATSYPDSCTLIMEQMFPDVDIVVSYRSTLAIEYQAYDKKVLFYEDSNIEEIAQKIKRLSVLKK